jgi:transposase
MHALAGSTNEENTRSLPATERKRRSILYKDKSDEEKKQLKVELDLELVPTAIRARLVEITPTPEQHQAIIVWFSDARRTYNLCMTLMIRNKWHKDRGKKPATIRQFMRDAFLTEKAISSSPYRKLLRTPKDIRDGAIDDVLTVLKAYRTNVDKAIAYDEYIPDGDFRKARAKKKLALAMKLNPKFKARIMKSSDSIHLQKNMIHIETDTVTDRVNLCPNFTRTSKKTGNREGKFEKKYAMSKKGLFCPVRTASNIVIPANAERDFKIHFKHGKLYFIFPYVHSVNERQLHNEKFDPDESSVVALDPGVRKFMTGYDPCGQVIFIGSNTQKVINKSLRRIKRTKAAVRKVRSKITDQKVARSKNRSQKQSVRHRLWRAKLAYHNAELKQKNIVKNLHYRTAHLLLRQYKTVILPTTTSQYWVKGKLRAITKLQANALSMGQFATRLVETSTFYKGRRVLRGAESYTSKQCGSCGTINDNRGGAEVFKCYKCKISADRDAHGARNILLKFMACDNHTGKSCDHCKVFVR